eukprot:COSAG02_NODE_432_length_22440_cov_53.821315_6_plen_266_part_00
MVVCVWEGGGAGVGDRDCTSNGRRPPVKCEATHENGQTTPVATELRVGKGGSGMFVCHQSGVRPIGKHVSRHDQRRASAAIVALPSIHTKLFSRTRTKTAVPACPPPQPGWELPSDLPYSPPSSPKPKPSQTKPLPSFAARFEKQAARERAHTQPPLPSHPTTQRPLPLPLHSATSISPAAPQHCSAAGRGGGCDDMASACSALNTRSPTTQQHAYPLPPSLPPPGAGGRASTAQQGGEGRLVPFLSLHSRDGGGANGHGRHAQL